MEARMICTAPRHIANGEMLRLVRTYGPDIFEAITEAKQIASDPNARGYTDLDELGGSRLAGLPSGLSPSAGYSHPDAG